MCVAYSGRCLTSEALGGRSAIAVNARRHLPTPVRTDLRRRGRRSRPEVSAQSAGPRGLCTGARTAASRRVRALKIEGRLKTPEYVANITQHYRRAIDSAVAGRPVGFTPRR
ncbi:MAG: U32 family peptidase [Planctomycetaceae bacterium]